VNIAWWLERAADENPDQLALVEARTGTAWTYGQLRQRSAAVADVLAEEYGVTAGDVVVSIMPDDCWHTALFFALQRLGAVFSGFNRMLTTGKFVTDANRLEAKLAVVGSAFRSVGDHLVERSGLERALLCDGAPDAADGVPDLAVLASARAGAPARRVAARLGSDAAAVNFTGGTSGVSKGVIFPHGALTLSAQGSLFYDRLVSRDVNLSCISLYHSGGIHDAVKWVMAGATNVLLGGWDADLAARTIERYQPTWIYFWVSTMVRDLMRHPSWPTLPLRGVKTIVSGEAVPVQLQSALLERGLAMSNSYGMSETMPVGILKPVVAYGDTPPLGSCGKPVPELCEVVLKDPHSGERVTQPGVTGEVCVRGPVVSPGYYKDAERTAAAFDSEGFLHTRDVAHFDADGWWFLGGRTDDIINSGGEKLSLDEVEQTLRGSPLVIEVACTSVAHERFGEVPVAVVVATADAPPDAELAAALDAHCIATMERWKRPRLYARVTEIPRTMPKRTKDLRALRAMVEGIKLREEHGVVDIAQVRPCMAESAAPDDPVGTPP
jgi:acyl-CoA synthetase (AMP-forming)/AMP-acid ligase II